MLIEYSFYVEKFQPFRNQLLDSSCPEEQYAVVPPNPNPNENLFSRRPGTPRQSSWQPPLNNKVRVLFRPKKQKGLQRNKKKNHQNVAADIKSYHESLHYFSFSQDQIECQIPIKVWFHSWCIITIILVTNVYLITIDASTLVSPSKMFRHSIN